MGTRYCPSGNCSDGIGVQRVDFFGYDEKEDNGFVGFYEYKGSFKNGKAHGKGSYVRMHSSISGDRFEGEFEEDQPRFGVWEMLRSTPWPKEAMNSCPWKYEGEFQNGKPHGKGKLTMRNGKVYEGTFQGSGGICYQGNCKNGKGAFIFWTGQHYVGEYKNGKRHGQGWIYDSANSYIYKGGWREGEEDGFGIKISYNSAKFEEGNWGDPEPNYRYEGMFSNGHSNGRGTEISRGGYLHEGIFSGSMCEEPNCKSLGKREEELKYITSLERHYFK